MSIYRVEYSPFTYYDAAAYSAPSSGRRRAGGGKKSNSLYPPVNATTTHADISLPDDCDVYAVRLQAVTKTAMPGE